MHPLAIVSQREIKDAQSTLRNMVSSHWKKWKEHCLEPQVVEPMLADVSARNGVFSAVEFSDVTRFLLVVSRFHKLKPRSALWRKRKREKKKKSGRHHGDAEVESDVTTVVDVEIGDAVEGIV